MGSVCLTTLLGTGVAQAQRPPGAPLPPPSGRAVARSELREYTLLLIDQAQMMADLGRRAGFVEGSRFTLHRPVVVRHPVTGRPLHDRFPIGTLRMQTLGESISLFVADGGMSRSPAVGDILTALDAPTETPDAAGDADRAAPRAPVRVAPRTGASQPPRANPPPEADETVQAEAAPAPGAPGPTTARPTTGVRPEAAPATEMQALALAWNETVGRRPDERIARWQRFLQQFPRSSYAPLLRQEVASLVAMRDGLQARATLESSLRAAEGRAAAERRLEAMSRIDPPTLLRAGDPAVFALQLPRGAEVSAVLLYVRRGGSGPFEPVPMRLEGDGFARATLPRGWLSTAGVQCFAEAVTASGASVPLWRSAAEPHVVEVEPPARVAPLPGGLTRIDLRFEQVDVGTRRNAAGIERVQRFTLVEGDFLRRVRLPWLYGYRAGFGVYDGAGIALSEVESDRPSVGSTVVYGYQELEFALSRLVFFIGRVQLGVHDGGLVGGAQARMRIGVERYTNLVIGGDVLSEVGQRAFFALHFSPTRRLPMVAQGEVFNQSVAGGDPMFRFVYQVGWRFNDWFSLAVRGSYQLRNLQNGGFGFGLSPSFDW